MRQNINRVQERGENVDRLGDKTQGLSDSAANFRRGANRVRKQMFWKNMKMRVWVIIGIIVLLLCLVIIPRKLEPLCPVREQPFFRLQEGEQTLANQSSFPVAVVKGK